MKTIGIIPARGGSKGLHRKNLRLLDGIPLIARPIIAAQNSKVIDNILVSTEDEEIAEVARSYGAEVPFLRPEILAKDETTIEDTLQNALCTYEDYSRLKFDIGVFLTPTDIFRDPEWITAAVEVLKTKPNIESAFSGFITFKNFWEALPDGGYQRVRPYMQIYGQRQERYRNKRIIYREDTGIACASRASLWRDGRRIGNAVEIIPNDSALSEIDIHTELDLFIAEKIIQYQKSEYTKNGAS